MVYALSNCTCGVVGIRVIVKRESDRSDRLLPLVPPNWLPFNHQSVARSSKDIILDMLWSSARGTCQTLLHSTPYIIALNIFE